jgi:cytochrome c biogenesis protein CcdA
MRQMLPIFGSVNAKEGNDRMNWKKKIPLIMAAVGVLSFVGAILLLALAVPKADATYKRVLEVIISCLMIILSLLIAYYLYVIRDAEPNFFLFDRAKKKNIPVENLNFTIVNERMSFFLTMVCESVEELWVDNVLESDRKLG